MKQRGRCTCFSPAKKSLRNAGTLDLAYIRSWLKEFSLLLESDEILLRFENAWKKWQAGSSR